MTTVGDYFTATVDSFWKWQEDGNVIAWADGTTIMFRTELIHVFERLRMPCLPPFGAVVLLLAACRDNWRQPPNKLGLLHGMLQAAKRGDRAQLLSRVGQGLERIHALPAGMRGSPEWKAELTAMVFEDQAEATLPGAYDHLTAVLRHGLSDQQLRPTAKRNAVDRLLRDLSWLDRGLNRVDAGALAMRMRTGLEQSIAPAPVELPAVGTARSLMQELKDDPELGGVARLAQLLAAAVHLPIPLTQRDELPVGGVSDISNRGSLDRLLLSELANDEMTLAVRVAMNEALYLRRETPPRTPSRRRLIVLDSGLRMWGVPRVYATAVGLALAADADGKATVDVFRAAGLDLAAVDMTTAAGLTDHLAALDHRAHPGETLQTLREEVDESAAALDVVLVTGDDVLRDRAFQRALAEEAFPALHLATVARDGKFQLHLQSPRGRKLLRQAQWNLDDVLAPPKKPTVKLLADSDQPRPAIFDVRPFPLLLSVPVDVERSWHIRDFGALTYTRDGRLLHWIQADYGARQLEENLPPGNLHWAATRERGGEIHAVIGKLSRNGLQVLRVLTHTKLVEHVRLELEIDQPRYVFGHGGAVFVGDASQLSAFSAVTGKMLCSFSTTGLTHVRSRFFMRRNQFHTRREWLAAAFNGTEVSLHEVVYANERNQTRIETVFETDEHEGPIGVLQNGDLFSIELNRLRRVRFEPHTGGSHAVTAISRNGSRLCYGSLSENGYVVDVKTLSAVRAPSANGLEPQLFAVAQPVTLRHRFQAIGVDVQNRLTLVGRRDLLWPFEGGETGVWRLPTKPVETTLRLRRPFEPLPAGPDNRYDLAVAKFADGSRGVLDARGLLHLMSSDESLPEMTIVLTEGSLAGWNSDGCCWGNRYFGGDIHTAHGDPRDFLHRFAERLT